MASTSETLIEIKLRANSESTSSVAPFIIDIDLNSQFQVALFITSPEKKNEINILQQCIEQDCIISISLNGINALESSNPVSMIHAGTSAQTFAHVKVDYNIFNDTKYQKIPLLSPKILFLEFRDYKCSGIRSSCL